MKELDKQFINYLSPRLLRFHWERENVANFRCPLCGDSQKSQTKARGYFFYDMKLDEFRFKCHNCGECDGWTFSFWLKKFDNTLYDEYNLERFNQTGSNKAKLEPMKQKPRLNQTVRLLEREAVRQTHLLGNMIKISALPEDHFARRYVVSRCIPEKFYELLYFTKNYQEDLKEFETDKEKWLKMPGDERLVIPFWTQDGRMKLVQGRAFDPNASLRYATTKPNNEDTKVFGEDRIIKGKTTMVVEGPIDSMFLPNCLASADGDLLSVKADIYIPDNQYRNKAVCSGIEKIINHGAKIVLFPPNVPWKDINDMVHPEKGGMSIRSLYQLIASNVFQGLQAQLRFADLRKV